MRQYEKHIAGEEDDISKEAQYSLVFDHFICGYLLSRLVKCFTSKYANYTEYDVSGFLKERFVGINNNSLDVFPENVHGFGINEMKDNEVTVEDKGYRSVYR